jgi:hypothetical protein
MLDLLVHIPDLPLYDDSAKVGFGLWRHVAISLPLELAFLAIGAWIYARAVPATSMRGRNVLWGFVRQSRWSSSGCGSQLERDFRRKKAAAEMIRRRLVALVAKPTIVKEGKNLDEGSASPICVALK